jgi:hypothetical protein
MPFTKVKKGEFGGGNSQALISIRKSESIGINEPTLALFDDDVEYIVMYDDLEANELTFVPDDGSDEDAYKLSISNNSATLGCSSYLKEYGLVPDITTRYEPDVKDIEMEDGSTIEDVVYIDLDDPYDTYGSADSDDEE